MLASLDWNAPEAVVACLKNIPSDENLPSDDPFSTISRALTTCRRVRDVLHTLYGPVDGLLGALKRLGDEPLPKDSYRTLIRLLIEPEHRARTKVLRQMSRITANHLTTLMSLEKPFILKELVERLRPKDVSQFWLAIALIHQLVPEATTEDLVASLTSLQPGVGLNRWVQKQVSRATRFPVTLSGLDKTFTPLTSAEAIRAKALQYQNCLRTELGEVALSRKYFLEYRPAPAIIELVALSEGRWACLDGIYGPKNASLDPGTKRIIRRKLQASGVLVHARHAEASRWNSVARLLSIYDHDDPILEGDFDLTELVGTG
ncbi:hypothetical protein [Microvirga aerophila]|uniref:hypothetical protein n=1 Tax=Microvirga aerophila TaxID=670291 RepID=UPI001AEF0E5B|nr:hypothetical protein [Microvirga aerophila]